MHTGRATRHKDRLLVSVHRNLTRSESEIQTRNIGHSDQKPGYYNSVLKDKRVENVRSKQSSFWRSFDACAFVRKGKEGNIYLVHSRVRPFLKSILILN